MKPLSSALPALALAVACLGLVQTAHAELADRAKPLNIEADAMRYDDAHKITTFTGRVVATKGTIVLRADKVEVRQDPQGNQFMYAEGSAGHQAFMRQKREGLNEYIEGEANRIERDDRTQIARLTGNARMRRLVGTQLADEVRGDTIVYNDLTDVYNVAGGPSTGARGAAAGAVPAGRVRAVINPVGQSGGKSALPMPATRAASKGARAASAPVTTLRSSATIGGRP